MALVLEHIDNKPKYIRVVSFKDSSVNCTREEYDEIYIESFKDKIGDEEILRLKDEPTRFKIMLDLSYDKETKLTRNESSIEDGKMKTSGTFIAEQFRLSFVGIINPADVPLNQRIKMKSHGDGGASIEMMSSLKRAGILSDLMSAYITASVGDRKESDEDSEELTETQEKKS